MRLALKIWPTRKVEPGLGGQSFSAISPLLREWPLRRPVKIIRGARGTVLRPLSCAVRHETLKLPQNGHRAEACRKIELFQNRNLAGAIFSAAGFGPVRVMVRRGAGHVRSFLMARRVAVGFPQSQPTRFGGCFCIPCPGSATVVDH